MVTFTRTRVGLAPDAAAPKTDLLGRLEEAFGPARVAAARGDRTADDARNAGTVQAIAEYRALAFRGRTYRVDPVSYLDGIEAQRLALALDQLTSQPVTDETLATYEALSRRIAEFAGRLLVPTTPGASRWIYKLTRFKRNPLRDATEHEIGAVLGFLLTCRTSTRVRLRVAEAATR